VPINRLIIKAVDRPRIKLTYEPIDEQAYVHPIKIHAELLCVLIDSLITESDDWPQNQANIRASWYGLECFMHDFFRGAGSG
jgi:hypothetical protein